MSVSYAVRVDERIRDEAAEVARAMVSIWRRRRGRSGRRWRGRRPFPLTFTREEPNGASMEAIRETEEIFERGTAPRFKDVDALFASLEA